MFKSKPQKSTYLLLADFYWLGLIKLILFYHSVHYWFDQYPQFSPNVCPYLVFRINLFCGVLFSYQLVGQFKDLYFVGSHFYCGSCISVPKVCIQDVSHHHWRKCQLENGFLLVHTINLHYVGGKWFCLWFTKQTNVNLGICTQIITLVRK